MSALDWLLGRGINGGFLPYIFGKPAQGRSGFGLGVGHFCGMEGLV